MLKNYELGKKEPKPQLQIVPAKPTETTLATLNLDKELLAQYRNAQSVLEDTLYDEQTPANQKAQVLNTITSILQQILKSQTELYDSERVKKIESTLISVLKKYPELAQAFIVDYEQALKDV